MPITARHSWAGGVLRLVKPLQVRSILQVTRPLGVLRPRRNDKHSVVLICMQSGQAGPALGQVFADIRGTLASLMSSKGTPEGLQRIILSWDFWEIDENTSNGGGVIPDLETLPRSFDSAEVLC